MLSTLMDCLVTAGALLDDNRFVVPKFKDVEAVDCPKGEDRVEVTLTPL